MSERRETRSEPGGGAEAAAAPGAAERPAGASLTAPTAGEVVRLVSPPPRAASSREVEARRLLGLDSIGLRVVFPGGPGASPGPGSGTGRPGAVPSVAPAAAPAPERRLDDAGKRDAHRERARRHRAAGDHHLSFIELVRALNAAAPTADLVSELAGAASRAGTRSELAATLEAAVGRAGTGIPAQRALARQLRRLGRFEAARSCLYRVLAERPADRRALRALAEVAHREGRAEEHDAALRMAVEAEVASGRTAPAARLALRRAVARLAGGDAAGGASRAAEAVALADRAGDGGALVAATATEAAALALVDPHGDAASAAARRLLAAARRAGSVSLAQAAAERLAVERDGAAAVLPLLADALLEAGDDRGAEQLLRASALAHPALELSARRLEGRLAARADWGALATFLRERSTRHPSREARAELLQRSAELLEDELGDRAAAAAVYAELAVLTGDPQALAAQRRLLEEGGDPAGAMQALDHAVMSAPDVASKVGALLARAQIKRERRDARGAIADLRRALALEPGSVPALAVLAELGETGADELAAAVATLSRGATVRADAMRVLARAFEAEGRGQEARAAWEERLDERPDDPEAIARLREVYARDGDHDATIALLADLLAGDSHGAESGERRRALARALEAAGRPELAVAHWRDAARQVPADPDALLGLAENRETAGDAEEAMWAYEGAAASHPIPVVRARLYTRLAALLEGRGDRRRAGTFRRRAAEIYRGAESRTEEHPVSDDAPTGVEEMPPEVIHIVRYRLADDDDEATVTVGLDDQGKPYRLGDEDEHTDVGAAEAAERTDAGAVELGERTDAGAAAGADRLDQGEGGDAGETTPAAVEALRPAATEEITDPEAGGGAARRRDPPEGSFEEATDPGIDPGLVRRAIAELREGPRPGMLVSAAVEGAQARPAAPAGPAPPSAGARAIAPAPPTQTATAPPPSTPPSTEATEGRHPAAPPAATAPPAPAASAPTRPPAATRTPTAPLAQLPATTAPRTPPADEPEAARHPAATSPSTPRAEPQAALTSPSTPPATPEQAARHPAATATPAAPSTPPATPEQAARYPTAAPTPEPPAAGAQSRPPPLRGKPKAEPAAPSGPFAALVAEAQVGRPPAVPAGAAPTLAAPPVAELPPAPVAPSPTAPTLDGAFGALLAEARQAVQARTRREAEPTAKFDVNPRELARGATWDPRPDATPLPPPQAGRRLTTGRYRAEAAPRARLASDPLDTDAHRALIRLAKARGELRRAALHASALVLAGVASPEERAVARIAAAEPLPLGSDEVLGLAGDELGHPAAQLLAAASAAVHAVHGRPWRKAEPFGVEAGPAAAAVADALIAAVRLLGLRAPELVLEDGSGAPIEVVLADPPKIAVRREAVREPRPAAELRFAAARALLAATPELSSVLVVPVADMPATVRALAATARGREGELARDEIRLARRLRRHLPPPDLEVIRRLAIALEHAEPLEPARLAEAAAHAAERAGLVLGGDLEAADRVLARAGRPRAAILLLCRFAASETYLAIADRAGLL